MVASASCFAQVLSLVDQGHFAQAVRHCGANKGSKGFPCREKFVSMLFALLGGAHSLREIFLGLATALGIFNHLGPTQAPRKSISAYANANRPWELYEDVLRILLLRCRDFAAS